MSCSKRRIRDLFLHGAPLTVLVTLAVWLGATTTSLGQIRFRVSPRFQLSDKVVLQRLSAREQSDLTRVDEYLANSQWEDAIETFRRLIENNHGGMLALDEWRSVPLRTYCHWRIAQLPAEALTLYRDRVDSVARSWYEEGVATRDTRRLEQVVNEAFCSRWGDKALLALGEIALERGEFGSARRYWQSIHRELMTADARPGWLAEAVASPERDSQESGPKPRAASQPPSWLFYPDSQISLPAVRARLALASILAGARRRAEYEIEILERLSPDAEGRLAARSGRYADTLRSLLSSSEQWAPVQSSDDWRTFAASADRAGGLSGALDPTGVAWSSPIRLPNSALVAYAEQLPPMLQTPRIAEDAVRPLSFYPVVIDDLVLFCNETRIYAYDLNTGKPAWGQADGVIYRPDIVPPANDSPRPRFGVPRFTLTAYEGKLYARMGYPVTGRVAVDEPIVWTSSLVCLDLERQGAKLWQIAPDDEGWEFEGSPLCDQQSVYVAMRRSDLTPQTYVACYDARTGALRWRTKICSADTPARGTVDEVTHNLLTLAEGTIYYNTNLGAVAAVAAEDGRIRWIARYRRAESGDVFNLASHFYRDLNPCVFHQNTLYVAPSDSEEIFALDATTGARLWTCSHPTDAIHLLGVTEDRLLASGRRLWWIDSLSGELLRCWPEADDAQPGYGRGLLAGKKILWPVRDQIWIFDAATARPSQEPIQLGSPEIRATGGNLVAGQGYLLVAGSDYLYGFSQESRPREEDASQILGQTRPLINNAFADAAQMRRVFGDSKPWRYSKPDLNIIVNSSPKLKTQTFQRE